MNTVKFSPNAKLRSFAANGNDLQALSSWHTADERSSMKKRAQNKFLSILHYIKTRPGKPKAPSNRSGVVYNCHPAHYEYEYEIIGESLRGMEHYTESPRHVDESDYDIPSK
eukprot:scaffold7003_cov106-Skeletonema_dohrnii-CCMP3373.AAC.9